MKEELTLKNIYQRRFSPDLVFRDQMWQVLCQQFFQRYIPANSVVLEIGAGYCEFINNIKAGHKFAVDLNPDTPRFAHPDVQVYLSSSTDLSMIKPKSIDAVFTSNFFEHLTRQDIILTLHEVARVLKPDGSILILQPNIRFCYRDYWMFFDHITPLDDRSLAEALETTGFRVAQTIVRFLPYTTKGRLPNSILLLKLYLRLPLIWRIVGAQTFMVAKLAHP
jgi:SAM-dependent methyltransferase